MDVVRELRDPVGLALAGATALAAFAILEGPLVAVFAGAAVLAFRAASGVAARRWLRGRAIRQDRPWYHPLTRREAEVAEIVATGLTNREIAERLVLSEHTIDNYVFRILNKLDLRNRTQIGVWVSERRRMGGT